MSASPLIPKSKFDFETVEKVKNADYNSVRCVLPQIFEWIEDINWPIAPELVKVLVEFDDMIIPHVIDLINKPDGLRECSIYYFMLPLLNKSQLLLLKNELERIAYTPSAFEKDAGYDKIALQYIKI